MSVCLYTHRLSWNWQSAGSLRAGQTHGPLWSQISTWSSWTLKNGKIETDEGLMWLMFPDPDKLAEKTHRRWKTSNRNTRSISGVRCLEQIHGDPVKELWASVNEKTTEVSGTYRRTRLSSFTSGTFTAWSTLRRKNWRQSINSHHRRNQNSESRSNQMFQIADGAADDLNIWCISAGVGWTQEFHSGIHLLCSESCQEFQQTQRVLVFTLYNDIQKFFNTINCWDAQKVSYCSETLIETCGNCGRRRAALM